MDSLEICVDIRVISESNIREHWSKAAKRHRDQKFITTQALIYANASKSLPVDITMIRMGKRHLDSDNLQSAFKYVRDAISEYFIEGTLPGRADDHKDLYWHYDQQKSSQYYIVIKISPRTPV